MRKKIEISVCQMRRETKIDCCFTFFPTGRDFYRRPRVPTRLLLGRTNFVNPKKGSFLFRGAAVKAECLLLPTIPGMTKGRGIFYRGCICLTCINAAFIKSLPFCSLNEPKTRLRYFWQAIYCTFFGGSSPEGPACYSLFSFFSFSRRKTKK